MAHTCPGALASTRRCRRGAVRGLGALPGHKQPGLLRTTLSKQTVRKTQTPPRRIVEVVFNAQDAVAADVGVSLQLPG